MNYDRVLLTLVNDFIIYTRSLNALLEDDACYFKRNDVSGIEENNVKKNEINSLLEKVVAELLALPPLAVCHGTINERLFQYVATMSETNKVAFEELLSTMAFEIAHYRKLISINKQVINFNLSYIKDLLLAIVHNKTNDDSEITYDRLGALES
jgi:hypothetical protein